MNRRELDGLPLLIGAAAGVFAGFCPSWFTVSSPFFHEQEARHGNIRRIRFGEAAATIIVVGMGAVRSRVDLWFSIVISAVFVGGYEYMIAHPATEDGPGADPAASPGTAAWPVTPHGRS